MSEELHRHLQNLVSNLSDHAVLELDSELLNSYLLRFRFEPSLIFDANDVKPDIIQVIHYSFMLLGRPDYYKIDPSNSIIELLETILSHFSFSQIAQIFDSFDGSKFDSIFRLCLKETSAPKIQKLALGILERACRLDIERLDELVILEIFKVLAKPAADVGVVNAIEKLLYHTLVLGAYKKVFSKKSIGILLEMKASADSYLVIRLLDLNIQLFEYFGGNVIDDAQVTPLFLFDKKSILQNDDLFYLNKLIDFHARVFDKSNIASETVIQFFEKQTEYLFQLYDKVDLLSINELTQFFANFSYYSQGHFQVLSTRYKILTPALLASAGDSKAMLFLSNVNPRVLTQFAKQLSEIHISNTSLPLLLSLISDETTFDLAKTTITMTAIKLLTFENSLILLHQLSQYNYSVKFLTEQLPNAIDEYLLDLNPDETNLARKNFKLNQVKLATLKSIYLHLNDNHPFKERVGVQIKILESGAIYSDNSVQAIVQSSTA